MSQVLPKTKGPGLLLSVSTTKPWLALRHREGRRSLRDRRGLHLEFHLRHALFLYTQGGQSSSTGVAAQAAQRLGWTGPSPLIVTRGRIHSSAKVVLLEVSSCDLQKAWNYLIKEFCVFVCSIFRKKHLRNYYICCEDCLSCIIFTGLSRGFFNVRHRTSELTSFIGLSLFLPTVSPQGGRKRIGLILLAVSPE